MICVDLVDFDWNLMFGFVVGQNSNGRLRFWWISLPRLFWNFVDFAVLTLFCLLGVELSNLCGFGFGDLW